MERAALNDLVRGLGCAEEHGGFVFLRDPHWSDAERAAAESLMHRARSPGLAADSTSGWLCLRTGGSSGAGKFARHDEHTVTAAVAGFCAHFSLARVNAVGVLPPWHVSGLMARIRAAATGGRYVGCEWKALAADRLPELDSNCPWVLSLVPTQLQRLLGSTAATTWLRRFAIIFLGGGPVWPELAEAAARAELPISLSYGMTETAAMVTAQRPEEFLAGDRSSGRPLPHARVGIDAGGCVTVAGESLFRGYFPEQREHVPFVTADLGRLDAQDRLHLLGRSDAVIITGGKKVQPSQVEAVLRATGEFDDVVVIGVPDREWGEQVVACYAPSPREPNIARAGARLAPHERPKRFVPVTPWPRNAQGKINRAALVAAATRAP